MTLDFISWMPEFFFLVSFLGLLCFGNTPGNTPFHESLAVPLYSLKKNFLKQEKPAQAIIATSGPTHSANFLAVWAVTFCVINFFLLFYCPIHTLMAGGSFLRQISSVQLTSVLWLFGAVVLLMALSWQKIAGIVHPEYITLALLAINGQHFLICSTDLIAIYVCLELQSFAIIVLCSLNYKSCYSIEAGIKYFLLSAFSSCLLLLGVGLIYLETGFTQCDHIVEFLKYTTDQANISLYLGVWLVSLGLLWKLSAAPFHFWVADVYMGAWSSVTLFLSTLPKIAVFGFFVQTWYPIWSITFDSSLVFFSVVSLLVGAIAPFGQTQLKRLLALSSVGHIGFMLMPLCVGPEAFASLFTYLALYLLTNLGLFGLIMWPITRGNQKASGPFYLWDLINLHQTSPAAAAAWTVIMISLAGLPPIAGFLGKLGVFLSAVNYQLYFLVTIALVSTLLSTIYYFKILKISYVDTPGNWSFYGKIASVNAYLIAIIVALLMVLLWHATPIILISHIMALACSIFIFLFFIFINTLYFFFLGNIETFNLFLFSRKYRNFQFSMKFSRNSFFFDKILFFRIRIFVKILFFRIISFFIFNK